MPKYNYRKIDTVLGNQIYRGDNGIMQIDSESHIPKDYIQTAFLSDEFRRAVTVLKNRGLGRYCRLVKPGKSKGKNFIHKTDMELMYIALRTQNPTLKKTVSNRLIKPRQLPLKLESATDILLKLIFNEMRQLNQHARMLLTELKG